MRKTLPSLKAVQEELGDGGGKMVYVFVSPRTDSFAQDSAALKEMAIGSNYQWKTARRHNIQYFLARALEMRFAGGCQPSYYLTPTVTRSDGGERVRLIGVLTSSSCAGS